MSFVSYCYLCSLFESALWLHVLILSSCYKHNLSEIKILFLPLQIWQ